ncbi:MAG: hypothetical protein AB1401_02310 [Thermodesulfobacteriota bacterium]
MIKRIKKLFENIESTITTLIVLFLLSSSVGILAVSKKALNFFLQTINIPTPLYITIILLVVVLILHLKARKSYSSQNLDLLANIIEKNSMQDAAIDELNKRIETIERHLEIDGVSKLNEYIKKLSTPK